MGAYDLTNSGTLFFLLKKAEQNFWLTLNLRQELSGMTETTEQFDEFLEHQRELKDSTSGVHNIIVDTIDRFILSVGHFIAWFNILLIVAIILNVILRYGGRYMQQDLGIEMGWLFQDLGGPKLEELQWHLYALTVMMGLSYAQTTDSHVRVDIIAEKLSERTVRKWEVFGIIFLLFPFIYIVFIHSLDFVADAWRVNEHSDAPLGLPWRWAIKSVIPISFFMLALATFSRLLRDVIFLINGSGSTTKKDAGVN